MPKAVLGVKLYNTTEVAELLGVTKETARKYISDGRIKAKKIGTRYYVSEEKLKAFLLAEE